MKHSWGDGTTYWKDEQMTDIVERLRVYVPNHGHDCDCWAWANDAADEIERLEHMQANLHGHIKRLENENSKLRAKARAALQKDES